MGLDTYERTLHIALSLNENYKVIDDFYIEKIRENNKNFEDFYKIKIVDFFVNLNRELS